MRQKMHSEQRMRSDNSCHNLFLNPLLVAQNENEFAISISDNKQINPFNSKQDLKMDFNIDLKDQIESNQPYNNQRYEKREGKQHVDPPTQNYSQQQNIQPEKKEGPTGCTRFFQVQFYEQYFQVSQVQVLQRIKMSLIPIKRDFIENIKPNPDFYGPFWILTTIIFLLGSAGNFASYLINIGSETDSFHFNMSLVRIGVGIVYPFGFGVPTLLYFILKFTGGMRLSLPEIICIYGYSFSVFVIIFILCIIPSEVLQWLLMVVGMLTTIAFLVLNLLQYLDDLAPAKKYVFLGIVGAAQITLFLVFKLVFFKLVYSSGQVQGQAANPAVLRF